MNKMLDKLLIWKEELSHKFSKYDIKSRLFSTAIQLTAAFLLFLLFLALFGNIDLFNKDRLPKMLSTPSIKMDEDQKVKLEDELRNDLDKAILEKEKEVDRLEQELKLVTEELTRTNKDLQFAKKSAATCSYSKKELQQDDALLIKEAKKLGLDIKIR